MELLNANRRVGPQLTYTPKVGAAQRQMVISRADAALGESGHQPILLRDTEFWPESDYQFIIEAIVKGGTRTWNAPQPTVIKSGISGISTTDWKTIRGDRYKNTIMIGAMVASMKYDNTTEFMVSAAPNVLYHQSTGGYNDHRQGDNKGTQIHAEMIFATQLKSLLVALREADEVPLGQFKPRKGLSAGGVTLDADLLIEKSSLCEGCRGTWNQFISGNDKDTIAYRLV